MEKLKLILKWVHIDKYALFFMFLACFIVVFKSMILDKKNKASIIKECQFEMARHLSGKVDTAYFDNDINTKSFIIKFEDGKIYKTPLFFKKFKWFS